MLVLNPSEFVYFNYTNAANRELCEVLYEGSFQVQGEKNDVMRRRMNKSSSLGIPMHPKKYLRGTTVKSWGCLHPLFINKTTGHLSMRYIFIASYAMCCSWSVFIFVFSLVQFSLLQKMVGSRTFILDRDTLRFNCMERSSFRCY